MEKIQILKDTPNGNGQIDAVSFIEEHYPETAKEFKKIQEEQYETFCKKQMDYGPSNISMGTGLGEAINYLNLIGFDFFSKSTDRIRPGCKIKTPHSWHLPIYSTSESAHNVGVEQGYVKKLESENKVQWNVLSDLREETIEYTNWLKNSSLDAGTLLKYIES